MMKLLHFICVGVGAFERVLKRTGFDHVGAADRRADTDFARGAERRQRTDRRRDASDNALRGRRIVAIGQNNDEFIAAEARRRILCADAVAQDPGDGAEGAIAGGVTAAVIDRLEAVEIDEEDGGRQMSDRPRPLFEPAPIEQTGQGVAAQRDSSREARLSRARVRGG